jgi:hypothetical protein
VNYLVDIIGSDFDKLWPCGSSSTMLGIFLIVQAHIKKALGPALLREVQATGLELEGPDPDRKQKAEPIV